MEMQKEILVFTDGSSLGNPGPGGWGAIIVYADGHVTELGGFEKKTTNNKMELQAVLSALSEIMKNDKENHVKLFADSQYVLLGVTGWANIWEKNGWRTKKKTEVENKDRWQQILQLKKEIESTRTIVFDYVPGHVKHPGNERADTIARSFAEGKKVVLFDGSLEKFSVLITDLTIDKEALAKRKKSRVRSRKTAYSYLSVVDGVAKRHSTWKECELRVKGKSNTKFKKAISKEDEQNILKEWDATIDSEA